MFCNNRIFINGASGRICGTYADGPFTHVQLVWLGGQMKWAVPRNHPTGVGGDLVQTIVSPDRPSNYW